MANVKFDRMGDITQQDIDNLTNRERTELMHYLADRLGFVCLEGDDFEEREVYAGEGYLAFIYKDDAGRNRCQNCRMCVQIEDGTYVCAHKGDKPVEVTDVCSDFEEE